MAGRDGWRVRGARLSKVICVLALLVWLAGGVRGGTRAWAGACPNEGPRQAQAHGPSLPDCRAYEQVSPVDKNQVDAQGRPGNAQSSPDGDRVRYYSITPFAGACAPPGGGKPTYVGAHEGIAEWSTQDVLACESPETSEIGFSDDLSEAVVWSEGLALSPGAPANQRGYYVRSTATGDYRLLTSVNGTVNEQGYFQLAGFSRDDSHLIFESREHLLPEAALGLPNVYEVDLHAAPAEQLSLVGVVPPGAEMSCGPSGSACETPTEGSIAGAGATPWATLSSPGQHFTQSAISTDGSHVFFTAEPSEHVYVRENGQSTIAVSEGPAHFWAATPDGRYALYGEDEALYRYDTQTDVRTELAPGAAGLLGVLGVSDDGRTAYFAASGVLAANKNEHGEEAVSESEVTNLYEWRQPSTGPATTTFISTLLNIGELGDELDWRDHLGHVFPQDYKTSRVTGDGGTLLFSSRRPLTGYDNAGCGKTGCQELFRYRAGQEGTAGSLLCVSCNPVGAPALGEALLAGEGTKQEAPTAEASLSRNISEDGARVFFETPDPLLTSDEDTGISPSCAPTATTTTGCDVYEWEAKGEGSCDSEAQNGGCLYLISSGVSHEQSYLLDISADGSVVFFLTREALVAADTDENVDVYDARVDGGKPPPKQCSPPTVLDAATGECEEPECFTSENCKPGPSESPIELPPSSTVFSGPENHPPLPSLEPCKPMRSVRCKTRTQMLAAALKACKKDKPRRKRARCERAARKKYGPAKRKR